LGAKSGNLVSCSTACYGDLPEVIARFNRSLNGRDIYFKILCLYKQNYILFVYRRSMLENRLNQPCIKEFLARAGYLPEYDLDQKLEIIGEKIRQGRDFPHEIGLFLDYPFEDVIGFIRNKGKGYKINGCWKVYSDINRAQVMFRSYRRCREILCAGVEQGMTIQEILSSALV